MQAANELRCMLPGEMYCPPLKAMNIKLRCSIPPQDRPACLAMTKKQVKISIKTPGFSLRNGEKNHISARVEIQIPKDSHECYAHYPREEGGCSECPRLVDCMFDSYLANLKGMQIAAEVHIVQAKLL